MTPIRIAAATAVLALFAVPAFAQSDPSTPSDQTMAPATADQQPTAPAAANAGVNTSGVIPLSSPTPPALASRLTAADPTVVSNGPVADTPENRAKYGGPMSRTGKRTAPAGN